MTFVEFHNGLRILHCIDRQELETAGVIKRGDHNAWGKFQQNPHRFFIRADDATAATIWTIMQRRMK